MSLTEGLDTSTSFGMAIYRILSIFADMEHEGIVTRTVAGLAAARQRGVTLGRKRSLSESQIAEAHGLMKIMKADAVAAQLGVGRSTLFRHLRRENPAPPR